VKQLKRESNTKLQKITDLLIYALIHYTKENGIGMTHIRHEEKNASKIVVTKWGKRKQDNIKVNVMVSETANGTHVSHRRIQL